MILRVMKNSALSAKIYAMTGTALSDHDYEALMALNSVPALANYLSENTRYSRVLKGISVSAIHRGRLEQLLKTQTADDILSLMHYTDSGSAFMLKIMEMQDGIEKLKIFLRLLHTGHPEQISVYTFSIPFGTKHISVDELAKVTDFNSLLDLLKPTPYYQIFRSFTDTPERQNLFHLEIALDSYWTVLINRYIKKYLKGEDAKLAYKVFGAETDLNNLIFLLRCKERFDMTDEEIYACVIPSYYRLTKELITRIVTAPSVNDAINIIKTETIYKNAFHRDDRFFEKRSKDYMAHLHRHILSAHPYSAQAAISYIYLRRIEIKNIVTIIEGIRYGLKPDKIREHLIGGIKGDDKT